MHSLSRKIKSHIQTSNQGASQIKTPSNHTQTWVGDGYKHPSQNVNKSSVNGLKGFLTLFLRLLGPFLKSITLFCIFSAFFLDFVHPRTSKESLSSSLREGVSIRVLSNSLLVEGVRDFPGIPGKSTQCCSETWNLWNCNTYLKILLICQFSGYFQRLIKCYEIATTVLLQFHSE